MLKVDRLRLLNGTVISLELAGGEFRFLSGPNGVGKSLLLRSLALLHRCSYESYTWQGAGIEALSPQRFRRQVHYVPPLPLDSAGTVGSFFELPWKMASAHGETADSRCADILKTEGFWERPFHLLSSGEKQFVQFQRALSLKPRVILLDEAFGNLDVARRASCEAQLEERRPQGLSAILVSHGIGATSETARAWDFQELVR